MLRAPAGSLIRRSLGAAAALALLTGSGTAPAWADNAVTPAAGASVVVTGAGWGHGRGMSQYGALGAAKKGLTTAQILAFYYPGTTVTKVADSVLRVGIIADNDGRLDLRPVAGQYVYDSAGRKYTLPVNAKKYTKWRISISGGKRVLAYRNTKGVYVNYTSKSKLNAARTWAVQNKKTGTIRLAMPDGSTRTYPGTMTLSTATVKGQLTTYVVNRLRLETYLRGVVPAEMPASWAPAAVQAQAVAARSYALYKKGQSTGAAYDLCDTSTCQVYKPITVRAAKADAAIKATVGRVLTYKGTVALTEFTSSNGGWIARGDFDYLTAKQDNYDPKKTWTVALTAAAIAKAYPAIGTFQSIQVTQRTDIGPYSGQGRVSKVTITGTKGSTTVSGTAFKTKFDLNETLFSLSAKTAPTATTTKK